MFYYIPNLNYFTLLTLETSDRLFKVNDILYNHLNYFTLLTLETSNRLFKVNDILYNQS